MQVFGHLPKTSGNLLSNESLSVNLESSLSFIKDEPTMDVDVVKTTENVQLSRCNLLEEKNTGESKKRNATTSTSKTKRTLEERYLEMRHKNNEASRKSRLLRKQKRQSLSQQVIQLEEHNKKLRRKAEELETLVRTIKSTFVKRINALTNK